MSKNFHLMAKPTSFECNLNCSYCFYLEKESLYREEQKCIAMSDEVLENYIKSYIESQSTDVVEFAWQGGEPTMAGLGFFQRALQYQTKHSNGKIIKNTLQTNGLLINEDWAHFLAKNQILVGISIDGMQIIHDCYRITRSGKGSFEKVVKAINLFNQYKVEYNTLTVINNKNYKYGADIYRFLKSLGANHHQYIPIVEVADIHFPDDDQIIKINHSSVKPFSTPRGGFGQFMADVFDEWIKEDVGRVFIQLFDATLISWFGYESSMCLFNKECGQSLIIERNGDVYSCDHFVYPEFRLGNIQQRSLQELISSERQNKFSCAKSVLSQQCQQCQFSIYCYGGCPKHRIDTSVDQLPHNYLCQSYQHYFKHVSKYMDFMVKELNQGRNVFSVMEWAKSQVE